MFNNDLYCYAWPRFANSPFIFSDDRLKTGESFIAGAMDTLKKLRPQTYEKHSVLPSDSNYGTSNDKLLHESGLMVQEVFYNAPELRHLVSMSSDADSNALYTISVPDSADPQIDPVEYSQYWGTTPASLNYIGIIPYLIKGVQELSAELTELKGFVAGCTTRPA